MTSPGMIRYVPTNILTTKTVMTSWGKSVLFRVCQLNQINSVLDRRQPGTNLYDCRFGWVSTEPATVYCKGNRSSQFTAREFQLVLGKH